MTPDSYKIAEYGSPFYYSFTLIFRQSSALGKRSYPIIQSPRFKLDPQVVKIFAAQIDVVCAPEGSPHEKAAFARRDEWLASLDDEQGVYVAIIASAMARLDAIPNRPATIDQALLNVINGADPYDAEDVTVRKSLALALRERIFGEPTASTLGERAESRAQSRR